MNGAYLIYREYIAQIISRQTASYKFGNERRRCNAVYPLEQAAGLLVPPSICYEIDAELSKTTKLLDHLMTQPVVLKKSLSYTMSCSVSHRFPSTSSYEFQVKDRACRLRPSGQR